MNKREQYMADTSDFLSFDLMLKATPSAERGRRFIYLEASGEGVDIQKERVLAKALEDSASYFLKFGNIDIDHYTVLGPRLGMMNAPTYEVGRPVAVEVRGDSTFVKAELYQGAGPMAEQANMVWESMTAINPPARWYPSVGGNILAKSIQIDPDNGDKITVIEKVRWSNIGISRTPVNPDLPCASASPIGVFAKSLNGFVLKALEASYSTNHAGMTGGGAFGVQSIDVGQKCPYSYYDFREKISDALNNGLVPTQTCDGLIAFAVNEFNLPPDAAAEWVGRFLDDLQLSLGAYNE